MTQPGLTALPDADPPCAGDSSSTPAPVQGPEGQEASLRRFIRLGLGCGCPEEILQDIRLVRPPPSLSHLPVSWLLEVGGRLLVLICQAELDTRTAETLRRLGAVALALRDGGGFNRVRIVLPVRAETSEVPFEVPALGERLHWHRLPVGDLPPLSEGAG